MNSANCDRPTPDDETGWLAFRYVAGELSADECAAFEQRLEQDLSAAEAVVRMVQLTQAVAALPALESEVVTIPSPAPANRRGRWAAAAAVAAALAAAFLVGRDAGQRDGDEAVPVANKNPASPTEGASELVGLWLRADADSQPFELERFGLSTQDEHGGDAADEADEPAVADAGEAFEVPGWMLAAIEKDVPANRERTGDGPRDPVSRTDGRTQGGPGRAVIGA